jgi:hypothetical protein
VGRETPNVVSYYRVWARCTSQDTKPAKCVLYSLCEFSLRATTQSKTIHDSRQGDKKSRRQTTPDDRVQQEEPELVT